MAVLCAASLLALGSPALSQERPAGEPSGRISVRQTQVAFIGSGTLGGGTLTYQGRSYPMKLGGLGIGGIGASHLSASGQVYGLTQLSDFSGTYMQIRSGWAVGDQGKGRLWLSNAKGVVISLEGTRKGLHLAMGAEGVVVQLK